MIEENEFIKVRVPQDLILEGNHYCPWCGQLMKKKERWDHYDRWFDWECQCESYQKSKEIIREIKKLSWALPDTKYVIKEIQKIEKKR